MEQAVTFFSRAKGAPLGQIYADGFAKFRRLFPLQKDQCDLKTIQQNAKIMTMN